MRLARRHLINIALTLCALLSLGAFAESAAPPLTSKPELGLHVTPVPLVQLVDAEVAPADVMAPAPVSAPGPSVPGVDDSDAVKLVLTGVSTLGELGKAKQWGPFTAVLLYVLVALFRRIAKASWFPVGKVKEALASQWGGWGLNLGVSLAGGFAVQLLTGSLTGAGVVAILISAVSSSLSAAGIVALVGDVKGRNNTAAKAGGDAAAGVTSKKQALEVLTGKD